jgi:ABC-2 type transport system permease protein
MVLRYTYLLRSSWPRILELAYWPTVQMILWGFITRFFTGHSDWVAQASGVLLSGVLLWDILFRAQLGVTLAFFEELYSRNLGHLFVSPLRPSELVLSLIGISLIRTVIGVGTAVLLAIPLYHFSLFSLGLPLIAFFANLLALGWALGIIISALVLRYGLGA